MYETIAAACSIAVALMLPACVAAAEDTKVATHIDAGTPSGSPIRGRLVLPSGVTVKNFPVGRCRDRGGG